jgi:hypothetical protein
MVLEIGIARKLLPAQGTSVLVVKRTLDTFGAKGMLTGSRNWLVKEIGADVTSKLLAEFFVELCKDRVPVLVGIRG